MKIIVSLFSARALYLLSDNIKLLVQIIIITDPTPAPPLEGRGAATAFVSKKDSAGIPL